MSLWKRIEIQKMLWERCVGEKMLDQRCKNDLSKFEEKLIELRVSL